jgi:hypothetical protein
MHGEELVGRKVILTPGIWRGKRGVIVEHTEGTILSYKINVEKCRRVGEHWISEIVPFAKDEFKLCGCPHRKRNRNEQIK